MHANQHAYSTDSQFAESLHLHQEMELCIDSDAQRNTGPTLLASCSFWLQSSYTISLSKSNRGMTFSFPWDKHS